jgi:hypothetical protein
MSRVADPVLEPYGSCLDLPSVATMLEEIQRAKVLTLLIGRKHRAAIKELEVQVRDLCEVADRFCDLLGPRNWIFHDRLSVSQVRGLLDLPAEDAERGLIEIYKNPDSLRLLIMPLNHFAALRKRMHLIEKAKADYAAGRYDSTALYLLPVMDGFVQELDPAGGGLHTRKAEELVAWDSVIGHHRGLTSAHRAFTKSVKKTVDEEVYELHRHGILHGTIIHFNNDVVATKAWNRLFAVADWAVSKERQAIPPKPEKTLWQVLTESAATMEKTRRAKEAMGEWSPSRLEEDEDGFGDDDVYKVSIEYLSAWQAGNYGAMAALIPRDDDTPGRRAGEVREVCEEYTLNGFRMRTLKHEAPAICMVEVDLTLTDGVHPAWLRWVRENEDRLPAAPNESADWRLYSWGPMAMLDAQRWQDREGPEDSDATAG